MDILILFYLWRYKKKSCLFVILTRLFVKFISNFV